MKRLTVIFLCLALLFASIGCSKEEAIKNDTINNQTAEERNKEENLDEKEVTILMPQYGKDNMGKMFKEFLVSEKYSFKKKTGINIKIEGIDANSIDDYIKKRNVKLYQEEGPTLLLIRLWGDTYDGLIDQGVALGVDEEQIPNLKKVCEPLKDGYLVPIGLFGSAMILKRDVLEDMGINQPSIDWTKEDYIEIRNRWLEENPAYFNPTEYHYLLSATTYDIDIFDEDNNRINIYNEEIKEYIKTIREEVFSGKYILNKDYTYENYYNMFMVPGSAEQKESFTKNVDVNSFVYPWNHYGRNIFNPINSMSMFALEEALILPDVTMKSVSSWGFIVNKNGENIDGGIKFLDHLLEDEAQLRLAQKINILAAPAIEDIDTKLKIEIEKQEDYNKEAFNKAVEFRSYIFDQLKKDNFTVSGKKNNEKQKYSNRKFNNLVFDIVFADEEYSDDKISEELKKLENELNIYLNE